MLRLLRRIAQRHLIQHLLFPLIVGVVVEALFAYRNAKHGDWEGFIHYFFSAERIGLVLGVSVTYLLLMYYFIKKDTDIGMKRLGIAELEETLENATGFFAIGTIKLKEWFEPITQAYFAAIAKRLLSSNPPFHCTRVLFFFTGSDMKNVDNLYLDGYYAKCLKEIHERFNAQLAFLERREIFRILTKELTFQDRRSLGCYPKWINWMDGKTLEKIKLSLLRRRIRNLAFALVEKNGHQNCVIRFSKHGQTLGLEVVEDPALIQPYLNLVNSIKGQIYHDPQAPPDQLVLKVRHNFSKYFF